MLKFFLIADGHFSWELSPTEIEVILRLVIKLLGKDSWPTKRLIKHYDKQRLAHMWAAFNQAKTCGPFDGLFSLGDNFYDWDDLGLNTESKLQEAKDFKHQLLHHFNLYDKRHIWVPGNHDLGFRNCSWSGNGPTLPPEANFSCYQDIYGPTYGVERLNDYYSAVWVSTTHIETLIAKPSKIADTKLDFLVERQHEELEFLDRTLKNLDGRFFFGVHDPGSFLSPQLTAILNRHLDKLAGSFIGHVHAEVLLKFAKLRPGFRSAFNRYKVQFIPSIWGFVLPLLFLPIGAGFAELILIDDKAVLRHHTVGIKKVKEIVL